MPIALPLSYSSKFGAAGWIRTTNIGHVRADLDIPLIGGLTSLG